MSTQNNRVTTQWHAILFLFYASSHIFVATVIFAFPANFEDSFITYRYIDAITQTGNFEFNYDGRPTYGMTGLLFPLAASALNFFMGDPIRSSTLTGLTFSIAALYFLTRYQSLNFLSILAVFSFSINPIFVRGSTNGLETSLVCLAIVILYLYTTRRTRPVIASLVTVLFYLIRPDIILVPVIFYSIHFINAKKCLFYYTLLVSIWLILILCILYHNFDSLFPLSAYIKFGGVAIISYFRWAVSQYYVFPALSSMPTLMCFLLSLALGGKRTLTFYAQHLLPVVVFLIYQSAALPIMNVGYRFFMPSLAIMVSFTLILLKAFDYSEEAFRGIRIVLVSVIFIFSIPSTFIHSKNTIIQARDHAEYESLGKFMSTIDGIIIASTEAGKLAYSTRPLRFFDVIGLNSEFVARNHRSSVYKSNLWDLFLEAGFPDIYVYPTQFIVSGSYAYWEDIDGFYDQYDCQTLRSLRICIWQDSRYRKALESALARFAGGEW